MAGYASDALVSTGWLSAHLNAPDVRVVDATFFLPNEKRVARAEYEAEHIPGAVFFDIDEIKDPENPLPHMLPPPEVFSSKVRKLGLGDGVRIIVYDRVGICSSPRVWWSFRVFGHDDIAVLDGGLAKWKAEGRPTESGPGPTPGERHFTARLQTTLVRDKDQILANLQSGREQILDARARGRFEAVDPELWPGRRWGHIPGSLNLPFPDLIDPEWATLLPQDMLRERFEAAGIDLSRPVITTCGSGVTAAVLNLGLYLIGHDRNAVYDGSWAEWGLEDAGTPVETGPPQAVRAEAD
jgi:thiosulfate/3-mercaptopyruvate sulfurtransferase